MGQPTDKNFAKLQVHLCICLLLHHHFSQLHQRLIHFVDVDLFETFFWRRNFCFFSAPLLLFVLDFILWKRMLAFNFFPINFMLDGKQGIECSGIFEGAEAEATALPIAILHDHGFLDLAKPLKILPHGSFSGTSFQSAHENLPRVHFRGAHLMRHCYLTKYLLFNTLAILTFLIHFIFHTYFIFQNYF